MTCKYEFKMFAPLLSLPSSEEEELMARPPSKLCKINHKQRYKHLTSTKDFTPHGGYIQKQCQAVLQVVHCSCKQGKCETGRCSCMSVRLSCTDFCRCQNCANVSQETEERATWDDDSDDSDRDDTDE